MKTLCVSLLLVASGTALAESEKPSPLNWLSFKDGWKQMRAEGRPMMMFVTMESCHHCDRMKRETYRESSVIANIRKNFIPVRVDGKKHPQLLRDIKLKLYPTTVFVAPNSEILAQVTGYVKADKLETQINKAKKRMVRLAQRKAEGQK